MKILSCFCSVVLLFNLNSYGIETDQFTAWGKEIKDSTKESNKKVNEVIDDVFFNQDNGNPNCTQMVKLTEKAFRGYRNKSEEIYQGFYIDSYPKDVSKENLWLFTNTETIYRNSPKDSFISLLEKYVAPTISLNGVRLGTDKISHFFLMGYDYYKLTLELKIENKKITEKQIFEKLFLQGDYMESSYLGLWMSTFSFGDLEANFQGFKFYSNLCEGKNPNYIFVNDQWKKVRDFKWEQYVSPYLDESVNFNIYQNKNWKWIKENLKTNCEKRSSAYKQDQDARYAKMLTTFKSEAHDYYKNWSTKSRMLLTFVKKGPKLKQHYLDEVCTEE